MVMPVFVAAGTYTSGTGALSVPMPAGYQQGDILVLLVESENQSIGSPSGWSNINSAGSGTAAADTSVWLGAFYKFASSSESNVTVADSGDHTSAVVLAFRRPGGSGNGYSGSPFSGSSQINTAASATAVTFPAVTTLIKDCLIVNVVAGSQDTTTAQASGWANASLANVTERFDSYTTDAGGGGISVATGELATPGSSGSTTATLANASIQVRLTFAISPAIPAEAPIHYGEATGVAGTGNVTVDIAAQNQVEIGDFLLLCVETANETVATPSGWTPVPTSSPQGTGTAGSTTATALHLFYRFADGQNSPANVTVNDPGDHAVATVLFIKYVDPVNPINVSAGDVASTATTSVVYPSVTTTRDNCLVLNIGTNATDTASQQQTAEAVNTNLVFRQMWNHNPFFFNSTQGNGGGLAVSAGLKETAGATGTSTATLNTSSVQARITIALRPMDNFYIYADTKTLHLIGATDITFDPPPPLIDIDIETFESASPPVGDLAWSDMFGGSFPSTVTRTTSHVTEGTYSWRYQASAGNVVGYSASLPDLTGYETLTLDLYIATLNAADGVVVKITDGSFSDYFEFNSTEVGVPIPVEFDLVAFESGGADLSSLTISFTAGDHSGGELSALLTGAVDFYTDNLFAPGNIEIVLGELTQAVLIF